MISTSSLTASYRRSSCLLLGVVVFVSLVTIFYSRNIRDRDATSFVSLLSKSRSSPPPLVSQGRWNPPHDWDGRVAVYDNFPSLNEHYAQSSKLLTRKWWHRADAQAFPSYEKTPAQLNSAHRIVSCMGPRGKRLNESPKDTIKRHLGVNTQFAQSPIGSNALVGFEADGCYDRHGKHDPYGLEPVNEEDIEDIDWNEVDWGTLQELCIDENRDRFDMTPRENFPAPPPTAGERDTVTTVPRTAVVFRTHQHYEYTREVLRNMRSIIQELNLYTGGQYQVFLLVEMKDQNLRIWDSDEAYDKAIQDWIPPEFRNITVLWNQWKWHEVYPLIQEDMLNVHMSQWFSIQFFRKLYPEFDFYWNWEMDIRFTGHHYDFVKAVDDFTQKQPRKGLWERNERLYMPQVHGSWDSFKQNVQARYEKDGSDTSIWGPKFPRDKPTKDQQETLWKLNIQPPVANPANDSFSWGVGEAADFLTFLPMFNPDPTNYVYRNNYKNYDPNIPGHELTRRTTIITLSRLSSRLLQVMEAENAKAPMRHMSSEMWPHSMSLHYGLKAVYVPHSVYLEQSWPSAALDWIFNNGDQPWVLDYHPQHEHLNRHGEGSGGPESPFGLEREHNWERSTWYYRNRLAERLYKRWLGWEYDGIGGQEWEHKHGLYCLPPMLLHPIKSLAEPSDYENGVLKGNKHR